MSVATSHKSMPASSPLKKISWEDFERKYLNKEDRYKYEWVDGGVVKTLRAMNQSQQCIFFPKLKQVHVYRGKQMTICTDDDICSAEPVIPGFLIPASGVFK